MELIIPKILATLILPPAGPLLLCFIGFMLNEKYRYTARFMLWTGFTSIVFFCLPISSYVLIESLERYPALDETKATKSNAQAIVVLGGGLRFDAREFGGDTVSALTLERIRYAARLHRITRLPIVVSGGKTRNAESSEAMMMRQTLRSEYGIKQILIEGESLTTDQNAQFTAELLKESGMENILLITHAWHMPRAVDSFRREGINVIPAPTAFESDKGDGLNPAHWIPSAKALYLSHLAVHEYLGQIWYRYRR